MTRRHRFTALGASALASLGSLLVPQLAQADVWREVTDVALGQETGEWSNKTDLADIDGDGDVDLLFANGSAYSEPDVAENNGVWINTGNDEDGIPQFRDVSREVLGDEGDFTRVLKGRDVTGDGIVDIIAGNTYETPSRLFVGLGEGKFEERSDLLPPVVASVGDLEVGDVDGDGDLDIVLADWGLDPVDDMLQDPFTAEGARPMVWLNELNGDAGAFVDATEDIVEDVPVAWAWEIELIDVDGDFDLDIMASSKVGEGSNLFLNDGGRFVSSDALPQFTNNYDFEPMFLVLPGESEPSLAVVTINDGEQVSHRFDLRERIFVADDDGAFEDATAKLWPDDENKGEDDNMVVVLDFDSDGDPDFLIGALGEGADRLHVNELDTEGHFVLDRNADLVTGLNNTPGTLGIALADLNGDNKLDVVQSQGELGDPERVYLGDEIAPDTAPPIVAGMTTRTEDDVTTVLARVHDNKSPSRAHDWQSVTAKVFVDGLEVDEQALTWTGEFMWRVDLDGLAANASVQICATDAASNEACGRMSDEVGDGKEDAAGPGGPSETEAGGCRVGGSPTPWALALLGLFGLARRRRR